MWNLPDCTLPACLHAACCHALATTYDSHSHAVIRTTAALQSAAVSLHRHQLLLHAHTITAPHVALHLPSLTEVYIAGLPMGFISGGDASSSSDSSTSCDVA